MPRKTTCALTILSLSASLAAVPMEAAAFEVDGDCAGWDQGDVGDWGGPVF